LVRGLDFDQYDRIKKFPILVKKIKKQGNLRKIDVLSSKETSKENWQLLKLVQEP
jgi:hypothetical protein